MSWSYPSANSKGIKLERFAPDISLRARTSSEDGWFHLGCQECPGPACFSKDRKNIYIYIYLYILYIYISYIYISIYCISIYIVYMYIYIYMWLFFKVWLRFLTVVLEHHRCQLQIVTSPPEAKWMNYNCTSWYWKVSFWWVIISISMGWSHFQDKRTPHIKNSSSTRLSASHIYKQLLYIKM